MGALSDEPPIRVRNGSMKITLVTGEWVASGQAWVPLDGHERGRVRRCRRVRDQVGSQASGSRSSARRSTFRYSDHKTVKFRINPSTSKDQGHAKGDPQEDGGQGLGAWAGRQGLHHRREGEGPRHQLDVRVRKPRRPFRDRHLSAAAPASEAAAADAPEEVALPRPGWLAAKPPGALRLRVTAGRQCPRCIGSAKGPHTGLASLMKSARRIRIASACVPAWNTISGSASRLSSM